MSIQRVQRFIRLMERASSGTLAPAEVVRYGLVSPEEIRGPADLAERECLERQGRRAWWSSGEVRAPWDRFPTPLPPGDAVGHIELPTPVVNVWFFGTCPVIQALVGLADDDLEALIYHQRYLVLNPGKQDAPSDDLIDFDRFSELHVRARQIGDRAFWAVAGGAAIREVLRRVDLETLADELRAEAAARPDGEERRALVDRLGMVELFRERSRSGELRRRTELTVMDALPVVPRHERDSGSEYAVRCARAAHRCARLRKMMTHQAPDVILRNERRMVQEAVDAVLDEVHRWRHSEVTDAS